MANLLPLLRQSVDWFKGLVREQGIMSEVRSSELEIGLSSNDGLVEVRGDTAVSAPRGLGLFMPLKRCVV